ncbi:putative zinc-binding dehydrogenase [Escherichia coli]|uniref:Putative zinc-binding dehydrogenase n=1 Tax=Escherichia coli TaxID=562 RepID=A0A376RHJ5_ECOLX|nr:putative zinc-binding dehydrogenase [Escherichia coli]
MIKVEYVGICGSDVHGFESGPFIPPKDPNQEIGLGHECAGTVVAVGSRVRKFKPGDRVNIEPGVPCGHCRYCLEGNITSARTLILWRHNPLRGALTHYLCHPESFTYKLPDNMDTMEGALVEPAAVGCMPRCWQMLNRVEDNYSGSRLYWFDDVASVQMPGRNGNCRR